MAKRKIKYFGCLKGEKLNELSADQRLKLFKSKNLYVTSRVLNLTSNNAINLLDASKFKVIQEPSKELLNTYYMFLIQAYQEDINNVFINFFHQFNNHIIGLKKKEAKRVSRLLYLNIINNKQAPSFDIVHMLENANGIPKLENTPKIDLYFMKRDTMKYRIIEEYPKGLDEFLIGDTTHFEKNLKDNVSVIKEVIQFEGELKIILALNEEYKFEKHNIIQSIPKDIGDDKNHQTTLNKIGLTATMPTDEEMDAYLMEHVFSKKTES